LIGKIEYDIYALSGTNTDHRTELAGGNNSLGYNQNDYLYAREVYWDCIDGNPDAEDHLPGSGIDS
jgi:hypothetical protein